MITLFLTRLPLDQTPADQPKLVSSVSEALLAKISLFTASQPAAPNHVDRATEPIHTTPRILSNAWKPTSANHTYPAKERYPQKSVKRYLFYYQSVGQKQDVTD